MDESPEQLLEESLKELQEKVTYETHDESWMEGNPSENPGETSRTLFIRISVEDLRRNARIRLIFAETPRNCRNNPRNS